MRVLTALRAGGISRAWRVPVYQTVAILWFDNTHYWILRTDDSSSSKRTLLCEAR